MGKQILGLMLLLSGMVVIGVESLIITVGVAITLLGTIILSSLK